MRVVVVGATGNTGTAILRRLAREPAVTEIDGIARRIPDVGSDPAYAGVTWHSIDVGPDDAVEQLTRVFAGAAVVIHLAWQIQPSHDRARIRRTNVEGTANVAEAVVRSSVPSLVVASSVGAYAPGPKDQFVDEDWPVTGVPGSDYSADKSDVEALLTMVELGHPGLRLVRIRPGLIFQSAAASEIARQFIGPFAPLSLLRFGRLPLIPSGPRLRVQAVHADDVAEAYVRAALTDVRGAFNIAAGPVLDSRTIGERFHSRPVPIPVDVLRWATAVAWYARLQPAEPGWVRLAAECPLMSTHRAETELGWKQRTDALDAFGELLTGMADSSGAGSDPLRPRPAAPARISALLSGQLPGHGDPY